ncbi:hypothetical protein [Paenibacillus guangzhouensis]|uniref:hypothetical protein n=1 Tax=Paenibacillus guangzhouensis TaxID=1473112 RepID=UPI00187B8F58|nr:hypothetical protein [Paenibacillus guangzhouensis]
MYDWGDIMFVIHAYLAKSSNPYSHERLASELSAYFDFETKNGLEIGASANPFTKQKYLILRWPGWNFSAHFETGHNVAADANYIASVTKDCPPEIKDCTERIRFVFSSDDGRDFTDHIISAIDYLVAIPGAIIFDESQEAIIHCW